MQVTISNQCVLVETCSKYQCISSYRSEHSYGITCGAWKEVEMGRCESLGVVYWKLRFLCYIYISPRQLLGHCCA